MSSNTTRRAIIQKNNPTILKIIVDVVMLVTIWRI